MLVKSGSRLFFGKNLLGCCAWRRFFLEPLSDCQLCQKWVINQNFLFVVGLVFFSFVWFWLSLTQTHNNFLTTVKSYVGFCARIKRTKGAELRGVWEFPPRRRSLGICGDERNRKRTKNVSKNIVKLTSTRFSIFSSGTRKDISQMKTTKFSFP